VVALLGMKEHFQRFLKVVGKKGYQKVVCLEEEYRRVYLRKLAVVVEEGYRKGVKGWQLR
jgi:hypothetical protein